MIRVRCEEELRDGEWRFGVVQMEEVEAGAEGRKAGHGRFVGAVHWSVAFDADGDWGREGRVCLAGGAELGVPDGEGAGLVFESLGVTLLGALVAETAVVGTTAFEACVGRRDVMGGSGVWVSRRRRSRL